MSIYKDHVDKQKAAKAATDEKERQDKEAREQRAAANAIAGKMWLEDVFLPEISEAKASLTADLVIDHSEAVVQRQLLSGTVNEVTFTMNPRRRGSYRSYVFALCIEDSGKVWSESRRPDDEWGQAYAVVNRERVAENFQSFGREKLQDYLKKRIESALNLGA
ncbi:hypothetical protein ACC718_19675 [Rhizobium ruizarguesonis]